MCVYRKASLKFRLRIYLTKPRAGVKSGEQAHGLGEAGGFHKHNIMPLGGCLIRSTGACERKRKCQKFSTCSRQETKRR